MHLELATTRLPTRIALFHIYAVFNPGGKEVADVFPVKKMPSSSQLVMPSRWVLP